MHAAKVHIKIAESERRFITPIRLAQIRAKLDGDKTSYAGAGNSCRARLSKKGFIAGRRPLVAWTN
jgi:hypothetical protein